MITIKEWLQLINYRITDGFEYKWKSFGNDAYGLCSDSDNYTVAVMFDTRDQTVYQVDVSDYQNNRAYRLTNPDFVDAYRAEANSRQINPTEAWEGVNYTELETVADFIKKADAIINGVDYDTRVEIELDLDDATITQLMHLAHQNDITLNQMVEKTLKQFLDKN